MRFSGSSWYAEAMPLLSKMEELPAALVETAIEAMTGSHLDEEEAAAFLVALAKKGESADDIGTAVTVLRRRMVKISRSHPTILDTCGTGGDGSGTFNISTAVALVVAAAGCAVVKHGNRSFSSRSGSADVLKELGVPIEKGPSWAQSCLDRLGFAFCFAPQFHPALAAIGPLRKKLGIRTIFNLVGPLLNPAAADYQLLGVGRVELLDPLAGAVKLLGIRQAFLVCGNDGFDEVSLCSPTQVRHVREERIVSLQWTAAHFGLPLCHLEELKAEGPEESARIVLGVLEGHGGPPEKIVLANAAAALLAAERVASLPEGVDAAAEAIRSGAALHLLEQLRIS